MGIMPDIHVNVNTGPNNSQVVFHNSGQVPLAPNAAKAVVAAVKPVGQANGNVQGQVAGSTIVFANPG